MRLVKESCSIPQVAASERGEAKTLLTEVMQICFRVKARNGRLCGHMSLGGCESNIF